MTRTIKSNSIKSNGVSLYTEVVEGNAPAIVLIPGMFSNTTFFNPLRKILEAKCSNAIVSYDRRGCGRSDIPVKGKYGMDYDTEDLFNVSRTIGADSEILAGASQGGQIALKYAFENSSEVEGLAMLSSSHNFAETFPLNSPRLFRLIGPAYIQSTLLFWQTCGLFSKKGDVDFEAIGLKDLREYSSLNVGNFANAIRVAKNVFKKREFKRVFAEYESSKELFKVDLSGEAEEVKCPVFIVQGDRDEFLGKNIDRVSSQFSSASKIESLLLDNAGHFVALTNPERFSSQFLNCFGLRN
jgi:pimeloyl-ACP methyl ester carboxylesterase